MLLLLILLLWQEIKNVPAINTISIIKLLIFNRIVLNYESKLWDIADLKVSILLNDVAILQVLLKFKKLNKRQIWKEKKQLCPIFYQLNTKAQKNQNILFTGWFSIFTFAKKYHTNGAKKKSTYTNQSASSDLTALKTKLKNTILTQKNPP